MGFSPVGKSPPPPKSLRSAPLPQQETETQRVLSSLGEKGKKGWGGARMGNSSAEGKVSVAKPLGRDLRGQGPPGVPPRFCHHQREEGEQKVLGLGKAPGGNGAGET